MPTVRKTSGADTMNATIMSKKNIAAPKTGRYSSGMRTLFFF
jgi:hypothetical protein